MKKIFFNLKTVNHLQLVKGCPTDMNGDNERIFLTGMAMELTMMITTMMEKQIRMIVIFTMDTLMDMKLTWRVS